MRAGLLTEQIEIISPEVSTNDFGEETTEWVTAYTTRARLVHNSGGRMNENNEIFYSAIKTFQIRDYVPINDYCRIVWKDRQYRILDIEPDKV